MPARPNRKMNFNKRVAKIVDSKLKNELELKRYYKYNAHSVTSTGAVSHISTISQGITNSTRIGSKISIKKLDMRFLVTNASLDDNNMIRIIIFRDLEQNQNANAPELVGTSGDQLLKTNTDNGFDLATLYVCNLAGYDVFNKDRYHILYDRVFETSFNNAINAPYNFNVFKSWKRGFPIEYHGAASSDTERGNLYIGYISDSSTSTHPTLAYTAQLWYTDA